MSMNKDLVAQAVAAIPLWMAFLDQKEAEQDALLSQMQGTKKASFMDKATSLLKKKKDDPNPHNAVTSDSPVPPVPLNLGKSSPASSDSPAPLDLGKSSADNPKPKDDMRWAPIEEEEVVDPIEEEEVVDPEEEKENNQFGSMFQGG